MYKWTFYAHNYDKIYVAVIMLYPQTFKHTPLHGDWAYKFIG